MKAATVTADVFLGPPPARHAPLLADLDRWVAEGWLRALDRSFAAFLAQKSPDADPLLILGAALASHQLGRGHACLDLQAALADAGRALSMPPEGAARVAEGAAPITAPSTLLAGVTLARWTQALAHPALVGSGPGATPLVRVGGRLYLRRYWQYEQSVRAAIAERVALPTAAAAPEAQATLAAALDVLFPHRDGAAADWQKIACALAVRQRFGIVTGGPGTGKTTTVVQLLAVLQPRAVRGQDGRGCRIALAAPTGKAAARLGRAGASSAPLRACRPAPAGRAADRSHHGAPPAGLPARSDFATTRAIHWRSTCWWSTRPRCWTWR